MSSDERDPYRLLGVHRRASAPEIARAYRRAARATHPDRHPDDPAAADDFRSLTGAYETLRDPSRRAAYDRRHPPVSQPAARSASADPYHVWLGARPPLWAGPVRVAPPADAGGPSHAVVHVEVEVYGLAGALLRSLRHRRFI